MQHSTHALRLARGVCAICLLLTMCAALWACGLSKGPRFDAPSALVSPYGAERAVAVWAVAPLRNESGTSAVDPMRVSDELVAQLQQVRGIQVLSLNRTLGVMRSIGMASIESQDDAQKLAAELGVDAMVVGTITAYDPYRPLQLGLAVALVAPAGSPIFEESEDRRPVDPYALQAMATDFGLPVGGGAGEGPASMVATHYDGGNHAVQQAVHAYARGRTDAVTPLGWEQHLASMRLFTKFACYDATARLLRQEHERLAGARLAAAKDE